jgi:hypothetical protein
VHLGQLGQGVSIDLAVRGVKIAGPVVKIALRSGFVGRWAS